MRSDQVGCLAFPPLRAGRLDEGGIVDAFAQRMMYSVAKDEHTATPLDVHHALAYAVRDRLMERWFRTQSAYYVADVEARLLPLPRVPAGARPRLQRGQPGRAGRLHPTRSAAWATTSRRSTRKSGTRASATAAWAGSRPASWSRWRPCGLPVLRLRHPLRVRHLPAARSWTGSQVEFPDNWLRYGNPWEIPRPDAVFPVRLLRTHRARDGTRTAARGVSWEDTEDVLGDGLRHPGRRATATTPSTPCGSGRPSRAASSTSALFNAGDYVRAVEDKTARGEHLQGPLSAGRPVRGQGAAPQAAVLLRRRRRSRTSCGDSGSSDRPTHRGPPVESRDPAQRHPPGPRHPRADAGARGRRAGLLGDGLGADPGASSATRTTRVLPEALETWPVELLPAAPAPPPSRSSRRSTGGSGRCRGRCPGDERRRGAATADHRASGGKRAHGAPRIRGQPFGERGRGAAHAAPEGDHLLATLDRLLPGRINNKTNGITPRRWLLQANPGLAALITEAIGDGWTTRLDDLRRLAPLAEDQTFRAEWAALKRVNKTVLAERARQRFRASTSTPRPSSTAR